MSSCNGCNSRLKRPVGSSGYCDPCWLTVRIERLVFTRCPAHTAVDLVEYLKGVTATLERACEKFEADRTAGFVTEEGVPIPGAREKILADRSGKDPFEKGIHQGERDKGASSTKRASSDSVAVKKEKEAESGKEALVDAKDGGCLGKLFQAYPYVLEYFCWNIFSGIFFHAGMPYPTVELVVE